MPPPKDPKKYKEYCEKLSIAGKGENNPMYGRHHTDEARMKISNAVKQRPPISDETRKKLRDKRKLRVMSPETCKKIGDANRRRIIKDETKKKISDANKGEKHPYFGKHRSEETCKKISIGIKNDYILHPEHKQSRLYKRTDHHRDLIRMSNKNRSYEILLKIQESNIGGFWYGNVRNDIPLREEIRKISEYTNWRNTILERDGYKDITTKEICIFPEVHHIIPIDTLIKKHIIKTLDDARSCKELWDTNNGITLEKINHIKLHGYSYNTIEELKEMYDIE